MSNINKSQEMSGMPANMKFVPAGNIFAPSPDPRDAEIAKLREALTKITAEIVKSIDLALKMEEASALAACALNLSLSVNRINSIAAQALAEPGGKL